MQEADQPKQPENSTERLPPEVICPVIRAMVKQEQLTVDKQGRADVNQLRVLLRQLSMPFYSHWVAYFSNQLRDIPRNLRREQFAPLKMEQGLIKHSCTTDILTKN